MYIRLLSYLILAYTIVCFFSSCSKNSNALNTVIERGELVVLTRLDQTTYFLNDNGATGFEYELASLFADKLGVKVRFIFPSEFQNILELSDTHEADFAAAGLSITPQREQTLRFTPSYYEVTQQLIYHYRTRRPKSIMSLKSPFFDVIKGSSHSENLQQLQQQRPSLRWSEINQTTVYELVSMVNDGLLDYTIADSNQFQLIRGQFPELNVAFNISEPEKIAWAFPKNSDVSLYNAAVSFLDELKKEGSLQQLQDQFFGYSKALNYVGLCTFSAHQQNRLPKLRSFFQSSAINYQLDWKLLAAVAYQESHWDRHAVSPTGVRGIMMLTKPTANQMGVTNRLDPAQSISGGARYLASRIKKIPERIAEPDRTWMALASYNIGFGHLEDARVLTQLQGADPDRWVEVKKRLPLLEKKQWYNQTKHGYARGTEPVKYVENIRHYYRILSRAHKQRQMLNEETTNGGALHIQPPAL